MMFALPDPDTLYHALLTRDASFDGCAYVGVTSTGIFCRLSCPASKPLRDNCVFLESPAVCLHAGFRACLRCRPLGAIAPDHAQQMARLDAAPSRRWSEADVAAAGFDPSTLRRAFKRQFGMTFLDMARMVRLRAAARALGSGASVIDAQLEAGFVSASGFRAAFARLLGHVPSRMGADAMLRTEWIDTPLGGMIVVTDDLALHLLELTGRRALGTKLRRLSAMVRAASVFVARQSQILRSRNWRGILLIGLPISACRWCCMAAHFFRVVWAMLREIPVGQTRSYGQTAQKIGRPDAVRAVAQANGANQIALMILCHRVVGADGALAGYGGGVWRKDRLIFLETQIAKRLHAHAHSI